MKEMFNHPNRQETINLHNDMTLSLCRSVRMRWFAAQTVFRSECVQQWVSVQVSHSTHSTVEDVTIERLKMQFASE